MWKNKEVKYMTYVYVFLLVCIVPFSKSPLLTLLAMGLCYGVALFFVSVIFRKINTINEAANDVIAHSKEPSFEGFCFSYEEGDIGILSDNFSEMVRILKESIELQQKEKIFLKDLINDISHQLKTPLSSLVVFHDILGKKELEEETKEQILGESEKQLTRMQWLIQSMLKLARIEAGAVEFQKKEQPLFPTIAGAVAALKDKAEQKSQVLEIVCQEDIVLSHDREWLQEALMNVIKNAVEYTGEGDRIRIEAEQNPLATIISVTDHGRGIPESKIDQIFTRFYRVQNEVNPNSVGLGLAITKSIVEGQGGRIRAESSTKEGSSFTRFVLTFYS